MAKSKELLSNEVELSLGDIRPIDEIHTDLYGALLGDIVISFPDSRPNTQYPNINNNQIEAFNYLNERLNSSTILAALGAMRAGKGGLLSMIHSVISQDNIKVSAYQHEIGTNRFSDVIATRDVSGNYLKTNARAESYHSFEELMNMTASQTDTLHLIDEFQFMSDVSVDILSYWKLQLQQRRSTAICFCLDLDYRSKPWESTQSLLEVIDYGVLLSARCDQTNEVAWRTMRYDHISQDQKIPASFDGTTIVSDDQANITSSYVPASEDVYRNAYSS